MQFDIRAYRHIIWDFNGTLLDDVEKAVSVMNSMLFRRSLTLVSREDYLRFFAFPVVDYYKLLGFDLKKENFDDISTEFVEGFYSDGYSCSLRESARETLEAARVRSISQSVFSASYMLHLQRYLDVLGIAGYFTSLCGQEDIRGGTKSHRAADHISGLAVCPRSILYIGDTVHDYETARLIGCDHLLVSNGHQARDRLLQVTDRVIDSLSELLHAFRVQLPFSM